MSAPQERTLARHVVLVGLMGTGKSTVARALAARVGRRMVDSDDDIEERTGSTVREIFERDGEPAFRALEAEALRTALASSEPSVIAAAGGVVLAEANRAALREADALVVWLRARPELLAQRVGTGGHRPLLDGDRLGTLQRMAVERDCLYREVADVCVDVDGRDVDDVVEAILR